GTAVVACNSTGLALGLASAQSNTAAPTTVAFSNFRPETRLTLAVSTINNDASVDFVISLGSLPLGLVGPQTVQAVVTNKGSNALTNLPVGLSITGADTFSDSKLIASLTACGGQTTVSFAPFTPAALGNDTVAVTVPPDDVASNNTNSRPLSETITQYSYKHPGTTLSGGVGLTGATGAFTAKFTTTAPTRITAVNL